MAEPSLSTPLGGVPVIPVAVIGIGAYLAWFGVHYWGSDTKWPSDPVKDVLQGKGLPAPAGQKSAAAVAAQVEAAQGALGQTPSSQAAAAGHPVTATLYDHAHLETLWTSNGGSPGTANIAAAIAQAESSGNPNATSPNPDGGTNAGLWQLDTKGVGAGYTVAQLKDPDTNARVTVFGSANGTNWGPWATYGSGAYRQFMR